MKKLNFLLFILLFPITLSAAADKVPQRIVSLAPNITEILYTLKAGSKIVGVTNADNYPKEVASITRIGNFDSPDLEKIVVLKPDLILACGYKSHPVFPALKKLGSRLIDYEPASLSDVFYMIDDITVHTGGIPGQSARMRERINRIARAIKGPAKRVAIIFWDDPLMTVGSQAYISEAVQAAGCINVFNDEHKSYFQTDPEQIIARKPDAVIILVMGRKPGAPLKSGALRNYCRTAGIKVIDYIDPDLFLRAGPRLADGIEQLKNILSERK